MADKKLLLNKFYSDRKVSIADAVADVYYDSYSGGELEQLRYRLDEALNALGNLVELLHNKNIMTIDELIDSRIIPFHYAYQEPSSND